MKLITRILVSLAVIAGLTVTPALGSERRPLVTVSGAVKVLPSTDTLKTNASASGGASINIPHGTAPSSPNNGDCWTTTAGLYCRVNGATVGPYGTGSGGAITAKDEGSNLTTAMTSIDFVGAGVTATNTGGDVTVNISGGGYNAENARDDIGAALVAGANITITPNDGADTITIAQSSFRGALVTKAADQTTANYTAGGAVIAWDSESYDTSTIHDNATNNSRVTVPSGVTKVQLRFGLVLSSVTAGEDVFVTFRKNGSDAFVGNGSFVIDTSNTSPRGAGGTAVLSVTAGDYFEVHLSLPADSSITVAANYSWMAMEVVE